MSSRTAASNRTACANVVVPIPSRVGLPPGRQDSRPEATGLRVKDAALGRTAVLQHLSDPSKAKYFRVLANMRETRPIIRLCVSVAVRVVEHLRSDNILLQGERHRQPVRREEVTAVIQGDEVTRARKREHLTFVECGMRPEELPHDVPSDVVHVTQCDLGHVHQAIRQSRGATDDVQRGQKVRRPCLGHHFLVLHVGQIDRDRSEERIELRRLAIVPLLRALPCIVGAAVHKHDVDGRDVSTSDLQTLLVTRLLLRDRCNLQEENKL